MKILIFGLVAVLCMQTIHAQCQSELANLAKAVLKFLGEFKVEHDKDRAYVKSIGLICKDLTAYLDYYGAPKYGENLSQEQRRTEVAAFVAGFFDQYIIASDIFTRLLNGINILKEMAACLVAKYGLNCQKDCNLSGCVAEKNDVACAISPLIDAVPASAAKALATVRYLKEEADILNEEARDLSSIYLLGCDSCGINLQISVIESFFKRFMKRHNKMHKKFLSLDELCDTIYGVIDAVTAEFESL